jgi:hypothetical protein
LQATIRAGRMAARERPTAWEVFSESYRGKLWVAVPKS